MAGAILLRPICCTNCGKVLLEAKQFTGVLSIDCPRCHVNNTIEAQDKHDARSVPYGDRANIQTKDLRQRTYPKPNTSVTSIKT